MVPTAVQYVEPHKACHHVSVEELPAIYLPYLMCTYSNHMEKNANCVCCHFDVVDYA